MKLERAVSGCSFEFQTIGSLQGENLFAEPGRLVRLKRGGQFSAQTEHQICARGRSHRIAGEGGEDGSRRANSSGEIEVMRGGLVEVDSAFHQTVSQDLVVKFDIGGWVTREGGRVVEAQQGRSGKHLL